MAVEVADSVAAKGVRVGRARSASPTMAVSINPFMYHSKKVSPMEKRRFHGTYTYFTGNAQSGN